MAPLDGIVRVGDLVWWTPARGRSPEPVEITAIDLCSAPGVKYGVPVNAVRRSNMSWCCFSLANGRWQYGNELKPLSAVEVAQLEREAA